MTQDKFNELIEKSKARLVYRKGLPRDHPDRLRDAPEWLAYYQKYPARLAERKNR